MVGADWKDLEPEPAERTKMRYVGEPRYNLKTGKIERVAELIFIRGNGEVKIERYETSEKMPLETAQETFGDRLKVYDPDVKITFRRAGEASRTVYPENGEGSIEALKRAIEQAYV